MAKKKIQTKQFKIEVNVTMTAVIFPGQSRQPFESEAKDSNRE